MVSEGAEIATAGILMDSDLEHVCAHDSCQSDKARDLRLRDCSITSPHWTLALLVGHVLESGKRRPLVEENERQLDFHLPDAWSGPSCHQSQRRLSAMGLSVAQVQSSRVFTCALLPLTQVASVTGSRVTRVHRCLFVSRNSCTLLLSQVASCRKELIVISIRR
jgi:hypothetical protein